MQVLLNSKKKKKIMILLNFMATITKTSIKKCIDVVYFKIKKVRKYLVLMSITRQRIAI